MVFLSLSDQCHEKKMCFVAGPSDIIKLFPRTGSELREMTDQCILSAQEAINNIISLPRDKRTYAKTVEALDDFYLNADIEVMRNILDIMQRVHPEKEFRELAAESNK